MARWQDGGSGIEIGAGKLLAVGCFVQHAGSSPSAAERVVGHFDPHTSLEGFHKKVGWPQCAAVALADALDWVDLVAGIAVPAAASKRKRQRPLVSDLPPNINECGPERGSEPNRQAVAARASSGRVAVALVAHQPMERAVALPACEVSAMCHVSPSAVITAGARSLSFIQQQADQTSQLESASCVNGQADEEVAAAEQAPREREAVALRRQLDGHVRDLVAARADVAATRAELDSQVARLGLRLDALQAATYHTLRAISSIEQRIRVGSEGT
jgi:hypothetical protein